VTRASLLRLGALACIWGSSFLFIELALRGLTPIQIVLGRLGAAVVVLLGIVVARRQALPRPAKMWLHLALMGVVANIIPFFLFGWGQQFITSGLAGVLNGTTPLFTLGIAAAALDEERLSRNRTLGLLIGFFGVIVVVGPWDQNPLTSHIPGQLACLGAAACYGVAFVYTRRFLANRGHPPLALATGQLAAATVILGLAAPLVAATPPLLTPTVLASVVALGAMGTGIAYLLFYRLITDAGATNASMVTYLIPVVAVILGVAALGEPVGWNLFAGAAVVIAGIALAEGRLDRVVPPTADAPPMSVEEEETC
jgi:drug/metabolite transporter (DMT)-like permease